jgi:hypothetical protein
MNATRTCQHSILWQRLDVPGHDVCRIEQSGDGWRISGTAVFLHLGLPACLSYALDCGASWRAVFGEVEGWIDATVVKLRITRDAAGRWSVNGISSDLDCIDLDFGFTPATNVAPLRRLNLAVGDAAEAPAAWLDVTSGALSLLPQRYARRSGSTYWYEAPSTGYAALLEADAATGFVRRYPALWIAVA